ncbi:hypothetical protein [Deinococcus knuensis]|uniref:FAD/NAD(P)-binding domain-containing protein n=1 Tax=Deinococcus knuensis TaxID=1837380 RepID=A0ABQ2SB89_9DEIO|nr:hypothetical protein [Deinococcus knuensis]GGS13971.1 hypothetical protein GCM10008961_01480 [Deinococcus knuensis]
MPATPPTQPACLSSRPPGRSLVTRVVIVGGGPAGLAAYRAILRACGSAVRGGDVHLTLISGTPDLHTPDLNADVLAGHLPAESARTPLRTLLPRATLLVGRVVQADLTMQRLQVSRADHDPCWLGFDHLILAEVRPDAQTGPLPERHSPHLPISVNVLGDGVAGVELALAACERQRARGARDLGGSVTLLCSGELCSGDLPSRHPDLTAPVRAALHGAGVTVHERTRVIGVERGGARDRHGRLHPAHLTVTADPRPSVTPGTEHLSRDGRGSLLTDRALRVPDTLNVWAARTAAQGRHAGQNVARALRRREARPVPEAPQWTARSVRLGHWNAVTLLRGPGAGLTVGGRPGWLLRALLLAAAAPADRVRVALALLRPVTRAAQDTPARARTTDRATPV